MLSPFILLAGKITRLKRAALLGVWLIAFSTGTFAQSQTSGRIVGTVRDQNGERIVGASVTILNSATALERKATTDDIGTFHVSLLSPGSYCVRITALGFAPA